MAEVIRFWTKMFDRDEERPNPYNPIHGESVLLWLAQKTNGNPKISPPESEDWGWCSHVAWRGRSYMLGVSDSDEEDGLQEWVLQIEKQRSLMERLLGKEKMAPDDECAEYFCGLLQREPAFKDVSVDPE